MHPHLAASGGLDPLDPVVAQGQERREEALLRVGLQAFTGLEAIPSSLRSGGMGEDGGCSVCVLLNQGPLC